MDKIVYLHENMKQVDIKYDFTLNQRDQAEPAEADVVVVDDWAFIQSIYFYGSTNQVKNLECKSIYYVNMNKFISKHFC